MEGWPPGSGSTGLPGSGDRSSCKHSHPGSLPVRRGDSHIPEGPTHAKDGTEGTAPKPHVVASCDRASNTVQTVACLLEVETETPEAAGMGSGMGWGP